MTKYRLQRRRPPADDLIQFRCSQTEKAHWYAVAARHGLQLGTYIKFLLKKEDNRNERN